MTGRRRIVVSPPAGDIARSASTPGPGVVFYFSWMVVRLTGGRHFGPLFVFAGRERKKERKKENIPSTQHLAGEKELLGNILATHKPMRVSVLSVRLYRVFWKIMKNWWYFPLPPGRTCGLLLVSGRRILASGEEEEE